ncbi:hypothetical protein HDU67_002734 [Dinochytrium kinnereticum]|nr:hypothetical protein HDU67_002734 [Dinochytrium kinnereticum]
MASATPPSLRFVDFFFQTGLPPDSNLVERRVLESEGAIEEVSLERRRGGGGSVAADGSTPIARTPLAEGHMNGRTPRLDSSFESVRFDMIELTPTTDSEPSTPFSPHETGTPTRKSMDSSQDKRRMTVTSKSSSHLDPAMMTPCKTKMSRRHPIEHKYSPEVLCRYPFEDYPDNCKFPQYLPMFCFPNDLTLRFEPDGPPASTYHSFVTEFNDILKIITEENGAKSYGVCVTIYEKLHPNLHSQLETAVEEWRNDCLAHSDLEYLQHIQSQLAMNQEIVLRIKNGMVADPRNPDEDPADVLAEAEEKVALYKELIGPMKSMLVDVDNVYAPRCIGLLSHWPWHDVFNDWLRELIKVVTGHYDETDNRAASTYAPLERRRCLTSLEFSENISAARKKRNGAHMM